MTRYWLSFDLGLQGDYEGLYGWLDGQQAKECGDSIATFQSEKTRDQLAKELRHLLGDAKNARIYIINKKIGGKFVLGKRKLRAPWNGYAEISVGGGEDI
jgi:hypothetical protein